MCRRTTQKGSNFISIAFVKSTISFVLNLIFEWWVTDDRNLMLVWESVLRHKETDINASDNTGWTALHVACKKNNLPIFKLLISKNSNHIKTTDDMTPLMVAARECADDIVGDQNCLMWFTNLWWFRSNMCAKIMT